jgi:peptidoglycan/LPS O-acetylase OafA/YrhL
MGATVYWNVQRGKAPTWLGLIVALAVAALVIDFRLRIAVALCVALTLGLARYSGFIESWPKLKLVAWLGQISYSVFLVHFPICLLVNALFERFVPHTPAVQLLGMFVAWVASVTFGALFYRQVECRAQRWLASKRA